MQPFVSIHVPYIMGVYTCIDKKDMYRTVSMARMCGKLEAGTHVLATMLFVYLHMHASERVHPITGRICKYPHISIMKIANLKLR